MSTNDKQERVFQTMPVNALVCRPQVREVFDEESLAGLAQTIKETGILQPLLVRRSGSEFVVLEGERRLRAARMAGLDRVPVIVDDRELSEGEVVYRQLVVNSSRQDLQPLERARAIKRLIELTSWPASRAAVKLGMSPGAVSKLLALLDLPETVQGQVASGALPAATAYALSRAPDGESQQALACEAANGGLKRDVVAARARNRKDNNSRAASGRKPRARFARVTLRIGPGCHLSAPGRGVSLDALAGSLTDFLGRITALEPGDMELAEAAKALGASS